MWRIQITIYLSNIGRLGGMKTEIHIWQGANFVPFHPKSFSMLIADADLGEKACMQHPA